MYGESNPGHQQYRNRHLVSLRRIWCACICYEFCCGVISSTERKVRILENGPRRDSVLFPDLMQKCGHNVVLEVQEQRPTSKDGTTVACPLSDADCDIVDCIAEPNRIGPRQKTKSIDKHLSRYTECTANPIQVINRQRCVPFLECFRYRVSRPQ